MRRMKEHLKTAIKAAGGLSSFAQAVGAPSSHAVKGWLMARVPADYCPDIERVTGVPCEALRPDVNWGVLRGTAQKVKEAA